MRIENGFHWASYAAGLLFHAARLSFPSRCGWKRTIIAIECHSYVIHSNV